MATFTAITLDRLLEPATTTTTTTKTKTKKPLVDKRRSLNKTEMEKKITQAKAFPLLYTTPKATQFPDDDPPDSYAPSPFIVNHKRRGPRLSKSFSQGDVSEVVVIVQEEEKQAEVVVEEEEDNGKSVELSGSAMVEEEEEKNGKSVELSGSAMVEEEEEEKNGKSVELSGSEVEEEEDDSSMSMLVGVSSEKDYVGEDFFEPQETMSISSNNFDAEEQSSKLNVPTTPISEFYDAYEELLSDGGSQSSYRDIESELHGIRSNLLMEIERRKQAEEALDTMRRGWQRLREQLSLAGLTLPESSTIETEDQDPAEDLCQQIDLARAISTSVGRASGKAEVEMQMESVIASKNFEIARLMDRLHYYEAMNHEMSQRKQEAAEMARRDRQKRKQMQRWIWGSIGVSVVLGSVALAWSYLPSGSESASTDSSHAPGGDDTAEP